jgi:uncharacterized repeat protein (TIGR03803 family)
MNTTDRGLEIIHRVGPGTTLTAGWRRGIGAVCLILMAAVVLPAQDEEPSPDTVRFKTLFNFGGANGAIPELSLVQGLDGNLYGTTFGGGTMDTNYCPPFYGGCGTVFKMTPGGTLTPIYDFCVDATCSDGTNPNQFGSLALDTDGNLFGMTESTVFKITPGGTLSTLHTFCSQYPNCFDGFIYYPTGVVRGADGNFYGVTLGGGNNACYGYPQNCGTIFTITPDGTLTTIYNFCAQPSCADGAQPSAGLVSGMDGSLYGTTTVGGTNGYGTIFKITPAGKLTTLHSFDDTQLVCSPNACAPMVQATNGKLYGATTTGGTNVGPNPNGNAGTFFEITPDGRFQTLYNFCAQSNCADGEYPLGFVQGTDGDFYGAAFSGGSKACPVGCGTIFKMTPQGALTILHSFNGSDGQNPTGLFQATNGVFYGEASSGYVNGPGNIFSLSVGLGPFVETLPSSGTAGEHVKILGTNLTGAVSVSFDGVAATFTVVSATELTTTVPAGARTGTVEVVTPTRTLKSNIKFRVLP